MGICIRKKADFGAALALWLGMAYLWRETEKFSSGAFTTNSPQFFPLTLIFLVCVLSLFLLLQSLGRSEAPERAPRLFSRTLLMQTAVVGLLGTYIGLLPVLGYVPDTILFLMAGMLLLDGRYTLRRVALYAAVSTLTTAVLYGVFGVLLHIFLP